MSNQPVNPQIDESWKAKLSSQFQAPYFATLKQFLVKEKQTQTIYPPGQLIFSAYNRTPFDQVNVVIIGQDPYHGPGQAHGLCFSVPAGVPQPPSLRNIITELKADLGIPTPTSGNLEHWADQGVLLLNATLTVRAHQAGSHQKKGWESFTDATIRTLAAEREGLVFLLWGRFAQNKAALIDANRHHILKAAHPSPLSAHNGFFGCKHFSQANQLLENQGKTPIDWSIP